MKLIHCLSAVALLFSAGVASAATVSLDLTSSLLTAAPGQTVLFSGTLVNTGSTAAFLNGDSFTSTLLTIDDTPFFLNVPASLAPAASITGPLFRASVPSTAAIGLYTGSFSVIGGDTAGAQTLLASQTFGVQVVPEPAAWILTLAGLATCLVLSRNVRSASI